MPIGRTLSHAAVPLLVPASLVPQQMVECIGKQLGLTSLRYQRLDDMIEAILQSVDVP